MALPSLRQGEVLLDTFAIRGAIRLSPHASVYRAFDIRLHRDVCLKLLPAEGGHGASPYAEARLASSLRSPFTIRIHACGDLPDGGSWFAMEWADGGSLRGLLDKAGPLPPASVLAMLGQIGASLHEAHGRGLLHRDIKPANVLLCDARTVDPVAKVADFGIAAPIEAVSGGRFAGTPAYVAPEVWRGVAADERADVYALAATAYELLTGAPPFTAADISALAAAHLHRPVVPPSRRVGPLPAALEQAVLRGLAKDPAERIQSVAALLDAAGGAIASRPSFVLSTVAGGSAAMPTATDLTLTRGGAATGLRERRAFVAVRVDPPSRAWRERAIRGGGVPVDDHTVAFGWPTAGADVALTAVRVAAAMGEGGRAAVCLARVDDAGDGTGGETSGGLRLTRGEGDAPPLPPHLAPPLPPAVDARLGSLIAACPPGEVVLDAAIHDRVERRYSALLERSVAQSLEGGGATRVRAGVLTEPSRFTPRLLPTAAPGTVGRHGELAELHGALDEALATERPAQILVIAEPGVGKSRLAHELLASLPDRGIDGAAVACLPGDEAVPLSLADGLVRALLALPPAGTLAELTDALQQRLAGSGHADARAIAADVATLLVRSPGARPDARRGAPERTRIAASLADAVAARCADAPLVVWLDDAHLGDPESLDLIDDLLAHLGAPLLLLATARPAIEAMRPGWLCGAWAPLRLAPLPEATMRRLCAGLLSRATGDVAGLVAWLVPRAAGVPLYAEELVAWCARTGALTQGDDGRWSVARIPLQDAIPAGLEELLAVSMASLTPQERQAAQIVAILGEQVTRADLEQAAPGALDAADALIRQGVLVPEADGWRLAHPLLAEAALATMVPADRESWHRLLAQRCEDEATGGAPRAASAAAWHWDRAGDAARALAAHERAGDQARRSFAGAAAARHFERALSLAEQLQAPPERRALLWIGRGRAHEQANDTERALDCWGRAEALAAEVADARRAASVRAEAAYLRGVALEVQGRHDDALAACRGAEALLADAPGEPSEHDHVLRARIGNWLGWVLGRLGRPDDARRAYEAALLGLEGAERERSTILSALAAVHSALGRPDAGIRRLHEESIRLKEHLAAQSGDRKPYGAACVNYADHLIRVGAPLPARRWLDEAAAVAEAIGDDTMRAVVQANLAEVALLEAHPDQALRHLSLAGRIARRHDIAWLAPELVRIEAHAAATLHDRPPPHGGPP